MKIRILIIMTTIILFSLACSVSGLTGLRETVTPVPTHTRASGLSPEPTAAITQTALPQTTDLPVQQQNTPAASSMGEDVVVVADNQFYFEERAYIVGIIQNNTDMSITWVEITVLLYDVNQQVITKEVVYPFFDIIPAGSTAPFSIFFEQWSGVHDYNFQIKWQETEELPVNGLELANFTSNSGENYFSVLGEIRNNSIVPIGWVKLAATLYAADGTLLNTNYAYSMLDYIQPGSSSPFKIWLNENLEGGDRYEIQVQGRVDEMLPEHVVEILVDRLTHDEGKCAIFGELKNNGAETLSHVRVVVAFYDAQNNLIDAIWGLSHSNNIPPGTTDTFEVISVDCPVYNRYEVYLSN